MKKIVAVILCLAAVHIATLLLFFALLVANVIAKDQVAPGVYLICLFALAHLFLLHLCLVGAYCMWFGKKISWRFGLFAWPCLGWGVVVAIMSAVQRLAC